MQLSLKPSLLNCEFNACISFFDFDWCPISYYLQTWEKPLGIYEMFTNLIIFSHCVSENLIFFMKFYPVFLFITV